MNYFLIYLQKLLPKALLLLLHLFESIFNLVGGLASHVLVPVWPTVVLDGRAATASSANPIGRHDLGEPVGLTSHCRELRRVAWGEE